LVLASTIQQKGRPSFSEKKYRSDNWSRYLKTRACIPARGTTLKKIIITITIMFEVKLKTIREKKKMSQQAFGELCGIKTNQEYGLIESGARTPGVDKAIKIAMALKLPVEKIWVFKK
jgi:DNA-binding XRE family transcriptional regulator